MSKTVSKEDILLAYLNNFYAGRGLYGAEAAAQGYFSKPANDLTPGQAALLMAATNNPSKYSPYTTEKLDGSESKEDLEKLKTLILNLTSAICKITANDSSYYSIKDNRLIDN